MWEFGKLTHLKTPHNMFSILVRKKDSANYAKEIKSDFQKKDFIEWKEDRVDFGRVILSGKSTDWFHHLSENLKSFFVFKREKPWNTDHFPFNLSHIHYPYFNMDWAETDQTTCGTCKCF